MRLQQRSWLIHWSLFVFFNHPKGQDDIIELLLYKPEYAHFFVFFNLLHFAFFSPSIPLSFPPSLAPPFPPIPFLPSSPSPLSLPSYLNAIHTSCPHILRYITAAVVTNKRRQSILKDLIRVIKRVCQRYPSNQDTIGAD